MKNKRFLAAFSAVMLLLTGCGTGAQESVTEAESPAETSAPVPDEKKLVTLGDSISYGYGLEDPATHRSSALLKTYLDNRDGITWSDYNYAVSGDDSSDLIRRLENGRAVRLPSSDIIVMCIGANNLLGVYSEYAMEKAAEFELDPKKVTEEDFAAVREKIEGETADQEAMQAEFQTRIYNNLVQLETDLAAVYQWVRERNTDAQFYVLNVYNPYTPDTDPGMMQDSASFYTFASENLTRLNTIIKDFTEAHDDLIFVDIAAAFAECDAPPVIGYTAVNTEQTGELQFYDPHPTADGQKLIADTVWAVMEQHS